MRCVLFHVRCVLCHVSAIVKRQCVVTGVWDCFTADAQATGRRLVHETRGTSYPRAGQCVGVCVCLALDYVCVALKSTRIASSRSVGLTHTCPSTAPLESATQKTANLLDHPLRGQSLPTEDSLKIQTEAEVPQNSAHSSVAQTLHTLCWADPPATGRATRTGSSLVKPQNEELRGQCGLILEREGRVRWRQNTQLRENNNKLTSILSFVSNTFSIVDTGFVAPVSRTITTQTTDRKTELSPRFGSGCFSGTHEKPANEINSFHSLKSS